MVEVNFSYDESKLSQPLTSLGDCINGENNHTGKKMNQEIIDSHLLVC